MSYTAYRYCYTIYRPTTHQVWNRHEEVEGSSGIHSAQGLHHRPQCTAERLHATHGALSPHSVVILSGWLKYRKKHTNKIKINK